MFVIISHDNTRGWQLTIATWGHGLRNAQRHYFHTLSDAVDAATNLNPVRIVRTTR